MERNAPSKLTAHIPISLSENLGPKEIGELIEVAAEDNCPPEDVIVTAIRELLERRRSRQLSLSFESKQPVPGERRDG